MRPGHKGPSPAEKATQEINDEYRRDELNDLLEILNTPAGRRYYMKTLGITGFLFKAIFHGNPRDQYELGKRAVGSAMWDDIQALGMDGLKLFQLAQREFVADQIERQQLIDFRIKRYEEENQNV